MAVGFHGLAGAGVVECKGWAMAAAVGNQSQFMQSISLCSAITIALLFGGEKARAGNGTTGIPNGGWVKYEGNPVMGGKYGTCFDISVLKEGDRYRMWLSWRPKQSLAVVESRDGFHWTEPPQIVLGPRKETGWEEDINRPVVLKR